MNHDPRVPVQSVHCIEPGNSPVVHDMFEMPARDHPTTAHCGQSDMKSVVGCGRRENTRRQLCVPQGQCFLRDGDHFCQRKHFLPQRSHSGRCTGQFAHDNVRHNHHKRPPVHVFEKHAAPFSKLVIEHAPKKEVSTYTRNGVVRIGFPRQQHCEPKVKIRIPLWIRTFMVMCVFVSYLSRQNLWWNGT